MHFLPHIKNYPVVILSLLLTVNAFGQHQRQERKMPSIGVITGSISDSISDKPIEYANITLINSRDSAAVTGGISNSMGDFDIREIPLGRYSIRFEFMGYETLVMDDIRLSPRESVEKDLGVIHLSPTTLEGDQVNVEGESPLFVQMIDKKVFNVDKSLNAEGNSAIEVLEQIPSVDVDVDGVISLRGSSNVKILIDGKPSGLSNEDNSSLLEQIPSSTIENVEIITNPSAKYDPEGMSGIINVVIKTNRLKGFTGTVGAGYADADRNSINGQVNFRNKKINISSMLAYRQGTHEMDGTNHMTTYDSSHVIRNITDQESDGVRRHGSYTGRLSTEYSLTPKNKLSAGLMLSQRSRNFEEHIDYEQGLTETTILPVYERDSDGESKSQSISYSFGWEKDFAGDGQELIADFRQTRNHSDESGEHVQNGYSDPISYFEEQYTDGEDETLTRTFQIDYVHPYGEKHKLELGLKSTTTEKDNRFGSQSLDSLGGVYVEDEHLNSHFLYNESIHSAYGTYGQQFGLIGIQGGLRLEQALTESDIFDGNTFSNDYQSIFPSFHLSYTLAPQRDVQVSYSRRVNRPRIRSLIPISRYHDPLNIRTGNPELLPEYIDSYELNYSQFSKGVSFSTGLYYRKINDLIRRYKEIQYIDGDAIAFLTYKNLDQGHSYGAEAMINGRFMKKVRLMLSGNVTRTIIDKSGLEADINTDSYGYFLRGTATYSPFENTDIQVFTMYRSPRQIAQGSMSDMLFSNLSIKQRFMENKGSVSLQVSDLFNGRRFEFDLETDQFDQIRKRSFGSRYIRVNFSYKFGKFVDTKRSRGAGGNGMEMDEMGID